MPRGRIKNDNALGGLNTKASPIGLPIGFQVDARNVRYSEGHPSRRPGMTRIDMVAPDTLGALDLQPSFGTDDVYVQIPLNTEIHQLPEQFTIDITVTPTTDPGDSHAESHIIAFNTLAAPQPWALGWTGGGTGSTGQITFNFLDENDNSFSLTSTTTFSIASVPVIPVRIVRNRNILKMIIDGVVEAQRNDLSETAFSKLPTSDLIVGSQTGGTSSDISHFDGIVDEFRIFHVALKGQPHAWVEFPDPRYHGLVAYYRFSDTIADTTLIIDDSRFGNNGVIVGTSFSFVTGLVTNAAPVTGLHYYNNIRGSSKVLIVADETFYESKII